MAVAQTSVDALAVTNASIPGRITEVSVRLPAGALVGIVGPNGSGKSTLLQVAAGFLTEHGNVCWDDREVTRISALERGRMTAWVPQQAVFEFGFSVRTVVAQGRFAHGDDEQGIEAALARFDLTKLAHRPVNELSGGERHRVLLARALTTGAPRQLWDEPLAPLDVRHALEVLVLARELTRQGSTVLLSLHDLRVARELDSVLVMHQGRLRASGVPRDVLTPALLLEVFGVKARSNGDLHLELP